MINATALTVADCSYVGAPAPLNTSLAEFISPQTNRVFVIQTNGTLVAAGSIIATNGFASYVTHTPVAVTVGGSPFSYTNNTPVAQEVHVGGGTITTISKNGVTIPDNNVNALQPTNYITITYTLIPTMTTNAW